MGLLDVLFRRRTTASVSLTPGASVADTVGGMTAGGEVAFEAGVYNVADVTLPDGVMFTARGPVILSVAGGSRIVTGDDFTLNPGFRFTTPDPDAPSTHGLWIAGKRNVLFAPQFRGFGNQITTELPVADAPYPLVVDSLTDGLWADWNHCYSPHFEFCYGGLLHRSVSNMMVSHLVARGSIGPGGAVRSHMSGSPAGAPVRINGMWTAHCEGAAVQFTKDADVSRAGGNIVSNWTCEPGAGAAGTAAYVESDGNKFVGAVDFIGGAVGFAWADGAKGNLVDAVVTRNVQGGVGPAVDTGPVADQVYR